MSNSNQFSPWQMVKEAIVALKERTGSSVYAISKFIQEKHPDLPANWKKTLGVQLKNLVKTGKLTKVKASFKLGEDLKAKKPAVKKAAAPAKATEKKVVKKAAKPKPAAAAAKPKTTPKKKAPAKPKAAKPSATKAKKAAVPVKKTTATKVKKAAPKKAKPAAKPKAKAAAKK